MTKYKIITNSPFDKGAPISYWIEQTKTYFFGVIKLRSTIGDYKWDTGGAIAEMPFFSKKVAENRVRILNNN